MTIEELYKKYRGHVFLLCRRYIRDPADAEDVVQTVFVKAWRAMGRFEHRAGHFTWLYRIGVNECLNYCKRRRRDMVEFDESLWPAESDLNFDVVERRLFWQRALHSLSRRERTIIFLVAIEGMSMTEAAEVAGISRQALHKKWNKIRMGIRKRIRGMV